jgi:hypothetical protein
MAQLDRDVYIPEYKEKDGYDKHHEKEQQAIKDAESMYRKNGGICGEILRWPRGDGYAQYMVTSEKPFKVAFIPAGDAWAVEMALIRGLRLKDVKDMVKSNSSMAKLFPGKGK